MTRHNPSRRTFLAASAGAALAPGVASATQPEPPTSEVFDYEVTRTEGEWRAMLTNEEFHILRRGSTELPKTSTLWNNTAAGSYHCKGCALTVYASDWKVELDKGWAFFKHAVPDAVMMSIDGVPAYGGMAATFEPMIEVHCRRCASHLGHILKVDGKVLHCINGKALTFRDQAA